MSARAIALVASVVSVGLATRYLGVVDFGVLTSAVVFVGLFQVLTEFGIGTVIVRRVTSGKGSLEDLTSLSLGLSWIYAVPVAGLAVGSAAFVYQGDVTRQLAVLILSVGLVFSALASSYTPVFSVNVKFSAPALADVLSRFATLAATATVVVTDSGLLALAAVQALPPLVQYLVVRRGARRLARVSPTFRPRAAWDLFKESLPLTLNILVGVLYWRADGVILSLLSSDDQVGAYGLALPLAFNLAIVGSLFAEASFAPIASRMAEDLEGSLAAVGRGMRFLLVCALPVAVLGFPLSAGLVGLISSAEFVNLTVDPLRLFFVAVSIGFFAPLVSGMLIVLNEQKYLVRLSAINLVANVVMNVVLTPFIGAEGSGIALVITEASGVLFATLRLRRSGARLNPLGAFFPVLVPTLAALGVCLLTLQVSIFLAIPVAGATYGVGLLLLRVVTLAEVRSLVGRAPAAETTDADQSEGAR